ncbi:tyrosine-type recombinase/integrase [Xanthomonadaceae bacterium JHOS43]|nr:tyrosine-type recombinase/integrase [Xanthomonadaceae bacterium JHOS43]MCX7562452.1 tyrosine-type recombinase/integrase [Xanthomonadaceae bacterium XH05]
MSGDSRLAADELLAAPDALTAPVLAYLEQLRVERGYAANTLAGYRRDLARLIGFTRTLAIAEWSVLTPEQLQRFIAGEHRRGLVPTSVQRLLSSCRGFFLHLVREGVLCATPAAGLRAPRARRKLPEVLDVDEITRLLDFPALTPEDIRDKAMLELFYSSGLRLAELCGLCWRDLNLEEGLVRVQGKGGKVRDVPVGRMACQALETLRAASGASPDWPVFKGRNGQAIERSTVQSRIRVIAQRQGIDKRVYPHLLRHSSASHLLESSQNLRGVQEFLGHADIATTQIYTHLDFQHLAKVYDAAHPRARRKR